MVKYFSLNRPPIKFEEGKLQENLKLLHRKMGEKFTLLYREKGKKIIKMPVVLFQEDDYKEYVLKYDKLYSDKEMFPLVLVFSNRETFEKDNSVYIAQVKRTDRLTGTEIVEIALKFSWLLGAERIYNGDNAKIDCKGREIQLSPFKLLEKNRTFYAKFGFQPYDLSGRDAYFEKSVKDAKREKDQAIKKIKSMRFESIRRYLMRIFRIITEVYETGKYDSIRIFHIRKIPSKRELCHTRRTFPISQNKEILQKMMSQITRLFEILPDRGRLWPWLKSAFYKKCELYQDFMENLVNNAYIGIEWKKRFIWNHYIKPFDALLTYSRLSLKIEKLK